MLCEVSIVEDGDGKKIVKEGHVARVHLRGVGGSWMLGFPKSHTRARLAEIPTLNMRDDSYSKNEGIQGVAIGLRARIRPMIYEKG